MKKNHHLQMGFFTPPPIVPPELGDLPESVGKKPLTYIDAKSILSPATGFIGSYDYTLNPASGCLYACDYCYAASFSTRADAQQTWGDWANIKRNAIELLTTKHPAGALDGKRIYASSVTDPYQPFERQVRLTRGLLEVLAEHHKVKLVVQTRSPMVTRDIDLFRRIEQGGGRAQVNMTVTAPPTEAGERIRKAFEPQCPSNAARLKAVSELDAAGVQCAITMTPTLLIDDPEGFADVLLATGARSFVVQKFHLQGSGFRASTRDGALETLTEILRCKREDVLAVYAQHYKRAVAVLKRHLPELGEGEEGFRPPF